MKVIFDGRVTLITEEIENKNIVAKISIKDKVTDKIIFSNETNREYAAVSEVINEFKKIMIETVKGK